MRQIDNTEPTQVQQPGRAAARTFWQTFIPALIGLVFILPEVLGILSSELGDPCRRRCARGCSVRPSSCPVSPARWPRLWPFRR